MGFANENDWFDYRLEHDPRFLQRVDSARASLRAGNGVRLEDLDLEPGVEPPKAPSPKRRSTTKPRAKPRRTTSATPRKADA